MRTMFAGNHTHSLFLSPDVSHYPTITLPLPSNHTLSLFRRMFVPQSATTRARCIRMRACVGLMSLSWGGRPDAAGLSSVCNEVRTGLMRSVRELLAALHHIAHMSAGVPDDHHRASYQDAVEPRRKHNQKPHGRPWPQQNMQSGPSSSNHPVEPSKLTRQGCMGGRSSLRKTVGIVTSN